ncbi:MAG: hypothetical protein L0287_25700 [Anaerolineae bacterium]|nr:hypothetical protein [Anaerolineae bacterium]MCI0611255.1 hypothetical protein [Anaerolineae bacterium]
MNSSRLKNEGWLYWLAFLLALGFRFIQLGASPLTDSEANLALQALHIAQGKSPLLDPQPAYILFTSILFAIIESTNFMARFVPALIGSTLVFVPYFFREKINARPALILAFLFAFDPGLVALSRQAGGTILAVTFLLFAWGMWINRRAIPTGIFAGLALLSGPSLWAGILALALTRFFLQGMQSRINTDQSSIENRKSELVNQESPITNYQLQPALLSLILTLLLGGTLFFLSPNGLSAWLSSLPEYLAGWVSPSAMTPGRMLLAFFVYEPLGLFIAALSIIRGFRTKSEHINRLSLWLGVSLLLGIFYRQATGLVWVIVPLLTLAAMELSRSMNIRSEERVEVGVVVMAVLILLIYIWFNISNIAVNPYTQIPAVMPFFGEVQNPRYMILYGASAILIVCIMMVGFGWSPRTARLGTAWSFTIFFSVYSLAAAWGASGLRNPTGVELWTPDPKPLQADLLLASVNDISEFSLGHVNSQPVTIMGIDSPALEWVLRNHAVEVVSALDPQVAPPLVITPPMDDLSLPSAYRGQDFTWRQTLLWDQIRNPDWWSWLVYRQLPRENEMIVLWARDDLFPDARENTAP